MAKKTAAAPDDASRQEQQARKLLAEQNYEAAIPLLSKLAALDATRFKEAVAWAKSELPVANQKQLKQRERTAAACEKARALLKSFAYLDAVQLLEAIPEAGRTAEHRQLLFEALERADECAGLKQEIDEAVKRQKYDRLLPLVKRYLKLKPDNAKMQRLAEHLIRNRPDRAVANYKETRRFIDVAGRLVEPKEVALSAFVIVALFLAVCYFASGYFANRNPVAIDVPPLVADAVPKPPNAIAPALQQLPQPVANNAAPPVVDAGPMPLKPDGAGLQPRPQPAADVAPPKVVDAEPKAPTPNASDLQPIGRAGDRVVVTISGIEFPLRYCPPGKFQMGTPANELGHQDNETQVEVTLTRGFWTLETEVTQAMYFAVKQARPWQGIRDVKVGTTYPAVNMSWDDASDFCQKLTASARREKVISANDMFALPTEAQWEYAARADTTTAYYFGNDAARLRNHAWYYDNAWKIGKRYAQKVGQKQPNKWGLLDVTGNVWEWCADYYVNRLPGGIDPQNPSVGSSRVLRGGSFYYDLTGYRVGGRIAPGDAQYSYGFSIGFRVVRVVE